MSNSRLFFLSFVSIALLLGFDLWEDLSHGADLLHVASEGVAALLCVLSATWIFLNRSQKWLRRETQLVGELSRVGRERDEWRTRSEQVLRGFGAVLDEQFSVWNLSPAEKEVALLILKGLSHGEIAEVRGASVRTVRQQAASVYGKAGLDGKAHLAAFFLEDLMLPVQSKLENAET